MRLIHLSDTHLGWRQLHRVDDQGRNQREMDVYDAFDRAIDKAIELRPDVVVHSGDVFDGYHPSSAALKVCLDGIGRLRDAGIPFVLIAGNHETPRVATAEHVFCLLERFDHTDLVHAVYAEPSRVRIGAASILCVPHANDADFARQALQTAEPDPDADFNVLVAHVGLDNLPPVGSAEAGSLVVSGGTMEVADDFDYVALGHLHAYNDVRDNLAYCGSLERFSWAKAEDDPKCILEVDLAAGCMSATFVTRHLIPGRPHVRLADIDASVVDDVETAIVAAADSVDHAGLKPVVRLLVGNITSTDWSGVDQRRVAAAFGDCLHVDVVPQIVGEDRLSLAPLDFREFLTTSPHVNGLDVEDVISRAEGFLALADQELSR
jgi:DNA repair protein SbcD/Mre11